MKLLLVLSCVFGAAFASPLAKKDTPIDKVIELIRNLAHEIEGDGRKEQMEYDTYACWVEDTLQRKASDISSAKELIGELNDAITKSKAYIASANADIKQLEKDVAQNEAAVKEAKEVRDKENKEYMEERTESEQCIGALEAAIKVLTGAGEKKDAGFLQQFHAAELMSVTMGVKNVLSKRQVQSLLTNDNLQVVKSFVENPMVFAKGGMSAAQVGQNPFGDYAPKSGQIQGILKGMYDAFTSDLEKENAEEANKEKSFQELFGTKMQELETLKATLEKQKGDAAAKTKKLAEDEKLRDDTEDQLKADEKFFEETKDSAETKATEWSNRTRLRTEELAGMEGAIQILSGGSEVFDNATNNKPLNPSLVELKAVHQHQNAQKEAYGHLQALATKLHSAQLAKLVMSEVLVLKSGGHFDKVIFKIDDMIKLLRKEEQEDIEHRDRCENSENANKNEMEDLDHSIEKTEGKLEVLGRTKDEKEKNLEAVKEEINTTETKMQELLDMRNDEVAEFRHGVKMDTEAVALIKAAIVRLTKYYKENKIPLEFAQQGPEYSEDPDKAPETSFNDADSHKAESGGVVAILEMISEDLEKEIKEAKADDKTAQADYEKQRGALEDTLNAQRETKVSLEKEIAGLDESESAAEKHKADKEADKKAEEDMKKALETDCEWVKTHFESRREKRKTEIAGLVEAKDFLAGVEAGNAVLPPE